MSEPLNSRLQLLLNETHSRIEVFRNANHPETISNVFFYDMLHPSRRNRREIIHPQSRLLKKIIAVMAILLHDVVIMDMSTQDTYTDRIGLCNFLLHGMDPVYVYATGRNCYRACCPPLPPNCEVFMTEGAAALYKFLSERPDCTPEMKENLEKCARQASESPITDSTAIVTPRKRPFSEVSSEPEPPPQSTSSARSTPAKQEVKPDSGTPFKGNDDSIVDSKMLETLQNVKNFLGEMDRIMTENQKLRKKVADLTQACNEKEEHTQQLKDDLVGYKTAAKAYEEIMGIIKRQEEH